MLYYFACDKNDLIITFANIHNNELIIILQDAARDNIRDILDTGRVNFGRSECSVRQVVLLLPYLVTRLTNKCFSLRT